MSTSHQKNDNEAEQINSPPGDEAPALLAEETKQEPQFLRNLCILPPRQKNSPVTKQRLAKDAILLPPISPSEPISAIRGAIAEIRGLAHITNYRLVLEDLDEDFLNLILSEHKKKSNKGDRGTETADAAAADVSSSSLVVNENRNGTQHKKNKQNNKKKKNMKSVVPIMSDVVSPYTCDQSSVEIPSVVMSEECEDIVLNEYELLSTLVDSGDLHSNMGFRMVLERYNEGTLRDHVQRTKVILDGNIPYVLGLVGANETEQDAVKETPSKEPEEQAQVTVEGTKEESEEKVAEEERQAEIDPNELKIPLFPMSEPVHVDGKNLQDFFYLACGEEERLALVTGKEYAVQSLEAVEKDEKQNKSNNNNNNNDKKSKAATSHELAKHLVNLGKKCRVDCTISFGGFNPPPAHRKMLGDLAYLEVMLPGGEGVVYITAMPTGFYINQSIYSQDGKMVFDPSPASEPCFSHELLDCLLLKSPSLRSTWAEALSASLERTELTTKEDDPLNAIFVAATHIDLGGENVGECRRALDSVTLRPSWLVPYPRDGKMPLHRHNYSTSRSEVTMADTFGLDIRNGSSRDWNEELQSAREMPKDTIEQRIERARMIHKTLGDFGDAAAAGVVAIFKGQIGPMNPNENVRSHVYLHNNIFFSRAVDSGADTFKLGQGDAFARKSALRDASCVGALHKLDIPGMHTLATVLVDYLGVRMVCQSIVPGILLGEKTHQILYGAVESSSPLAWDKDMHEKLDKNLGKSMMIASRKVLRTPLNDDRIEKVSSPENKSDGEEITKDDVIDYFGSVEMKAIRGSDHRSYCLDLTRLTPRDANWVPHTEGGTGNWERNLGKNTNKIPSDLQDDEWVMSILRPELVMRFTSMKLQEKTASSKSKANSDEDNSSEKQVEDAVSNDDAQDVLDSLRMNLNVFLPHLKTLEHVDNAEFEKIKKDEELAREVAAVLWDKILPEVTKAVKDAPGQVPVDGKSLTEFLHDRGVNCRYLGRLASLASEQERNDVQEEKDLIAGKISSIPRRSMPFCWLELLECEMVARAAKHVLDKYLTENGGASAAQVSKTVASFLSALMSMSEESAADTERRLEKNNSNSDDKSQLSLFESRVTNAVVRGRNEIWTEIENEVGRRFRYTLRLYNKKDQASMSRAPLIPLLRRVCQRSGIRLFAKEYNIGSKGLCDANISYPISASDIVEVLPMLRHAANDGRESFAPFSNGADAANSSLHILLNEAKQAYDAATVLLNEKNFNLALEYIQEATTLYQRITDSPLHSRVSKCLDLTTLILYQAKEYEMSANHASKALAVSMQISGFDSADVVGAHMVLSHVALQSGHLATSIKHHRSVLYLTELLAGPHHTELSALYHKLSGIYSDVGSVFVALRFLQTAMTRKNSDRVFQAVLNRQVAQIYARLGQLRLAVEKEKETFHIFRMTLGNDHEFTKSSKEMLQEYMVAAQAQGKLLAEQEEKQMAEANANAIADEIIADEIAEEKRKKKKKNKSKAKKKK
eukprot:CAMPEP_0176493360 /NCGR_PEP_ID=MMETSP0200_2-20121128/9508_1 /TAXON_ID=947934 /ORGANISM="Chaetoceros sp., Strain GSL56" /LENGTH=1500 /DNA_ID=CAMNT_0017891019 /DNA_START=61 /DNA_END=4563 /DNA_ORIENTATION=-